MELETRKVRHPRERSRAAWNDFVRGSAGWELQLDDFNPVGTRFRRPFLIEEVLADAVGISHQHVGAAAGSAKRTVGDRQVVTNQIEFRVAGCGNRILCGFEIHTSRSSTASSSRSVFAVIA